MAKQWHMQRQGDEYGPYSWEELQQHALAGSIISSDLVKSDEMFQWVPASEVPGLIPNVSAKAPAPPMAGFSTEPPAKKKKSPLKIFAIIGGSIVGLAVLGFIVLVIIGIFLAEEEEFAVSKINTASGVTDEGLPVGIQDTFESDVKEIYVTMEVKGADAGTRIASTWVWEDRDQVIGDVYVNLSAGSSNPYFYFTP